MPEPIKNKRARKRVPKPNLNAAIGDGSGDPSTPPEDAEVTEGSIPVEPVETDAPTGQADRETGAEEHNGRGVAQLLHDPEFMNQMITELLASRTLDSVTEEIVDKLSEALENNPEFSRRLIDTFMSSDAARAKFIRATTKGLA